MFNGKLYRWWYHIICNGGGLAVLHGLRAEASENAHYVSQVLKGEIMKRMSLFILVFLTGYILAAGTGEYRISGTVMQKGAGPLEGVTVLLKGVNDSTVTGTDGTFSIVSPVAVRIHAPQARTLSFSLRGNTVAFSRNTGKLSGNVIVLSAKGRCLASVDFSNINPATQQIRLPQLVSGVNVIRLTVNNAVYTCQVIRLGKELHLVNKQTGSSSRGDFSLAKVTSSSEAVDTLIAVKEGFQDAVVPVESYILSDVAIEMDSSTAGVEIAWGRKENPTAGLCPVGDLPGYNELTADNKLPDPFMKLDGTRITSRSEWACRREELYQQALHYLYGEKPVPSEGSVTGSVSTSKIEVKVNDGDHRCSFTCTVDMNGATAPAPAIVHLDGGSTPIPRGVAKIILNATHPEHKVPKVGPFFECYGSNHPAGYTTAWAWQVSRIIDVLEQHPDIIAPYRIGVTGCSRWGKGAFVCGVLDNRVALTLPFESGAGGTVALRLIEVLDPTGEFAYNCIGGIAYWLSEVQLGPFSSGNNPRGDNTNRLPIDMHEMMALIAPRGLYIIDNPNSSISWADENAAWVTANAGKKIFEALGVGDNITCESTSGGHCSWRSGYDASYEAMIDKFLFGNESAETGNFHTEARNPPNPEDHYDWEVPELDGEL